MIAQEPTSVPPLSSSKFSCPYCGRELTALAKEASFCPYCGKEISTRKVEAPPAKVAELPPRIRKMRKYAKMTALSGVLIAVAPLILLFLGGVLAGEPGKYMFPFLHEWTYTNGPLLWNGIIIGVLILIASGIARSFMISVPADLYIRRILGVLLLAATPAILLNPLTVFIVPVSLALGIAMGVYLLRNRGHRLKSDVIWVLLGSLTYALISQPPLYGLKGFILTADWTSEGVGIPPTWLWTVLLIFTVNIMILGSAVFLLVTDVLFKRWTVSRPTKRGLASAVLLLVVLGTLFGLPWLYRVEVGTGGMFSVWGVGAGLGPMGPNMTSVSFDSQNDTWVYRITLINDIQEEVEITGIAGKMTSQTKLIAPPFGENIEVIGGERTADRIVIRPGATTVIKIHSRDPLRHITLIENGNIRWQISFWR